MLLKSIGHHNTGTRPEEVRKEPMATARTQEQQQQATLFFTLLFVSWQNEATREVTRKGQ
jgi:hypothetical protein